MSHVLELYVENVKVAYLTPGESLLILVDHGPPPADGQSIR
jgi:hypothetical protein